MAGRADDMSALVDDMSAPADDAGVDQGPVPGRELGQECSADLECASGRCLKLDATTPGTCTASCDADAVCGQAARCGQLEDDPLCVPPSWCSGSPDQPCAPLVAPTIAEAGQLAQRPGQLVVALGYHRAFDGGGGVFDVVESSCLGDGGTCFVPQVSQGEELVDQIMLSKGGENTMAFESLPQGEHVVWGSLTVELHEADDSGLLMAVDDVHLHGHRWGNRDGIRPNVSYQEGHYVDRRSRPLRGLAKDAHQGPEPWKTTLVRFRYTPTAGPLRMERRGVGQLLDLRWFGARTHDEDPDFDNQPLIAWAMNAAKAKNAQNPEAITTVYLPDKGAGDDGVYEYFGTIEIPQGVTLKGAAGTELVETTTSLSSPYHGLPQGEVVLHKDLYFEVNGEQITYHYKPVRVRPERTVLRLKPGEAMKHVRMIKDQGDPHKLPWDAKQAFRARTTAIWSETNSMMMGVEDLVLDGNWKGNTDVFTQGWSTEREREAWMRNSPGWAGIVANNHGGVEIPKGQQVVVRRVAVLGYGANGLLGHAVGEWTVEDVRLGDSLYNHVQYNASGSYKNLTMTGFAWGHAAWYGGTIENFVYEDGTANEYKRDLEIFGIRGGDVATREEAPERWVGTEIDGFFVDLRGAGASGVFAGLGPHVKIRDGVLVGSDTQRMGSIYKEAGNGYQDALYHDNLIENVWAFYNFARESDASVSENGLGTQNTTGSAYRDLHFISTLEKATFNVLWKSTPAYRRHSSWQQGRRVQLFEDIDASGVSVNYGMRLGSHEQSPGHDIFWRRVKLNNSSSGLIVNKSSSGKLEDFPHIDKLRVFLEDVELNLHTRYGNWEVFMALARMRRVTDRRSGATSEDSGTWSTTAAGGEDAVEIPTNLLWAPKAYEITGGASAGLVESVELVSSNGPKDWRQPLLKAHLTRALQAGERVELTWQGAVRPWEEGVEVPQIP